MLSKKVSATGSYRNRRAADSPLRRRLAVAAVLLAGLGLAACSSQPPGARYELRGAVVAVNPQLRLVTVAH